MVQLFSMCSWATIIFAQACCFIRKHSWNRRPFFFSFFFFKSFCWTTIQKQCLTFLGSFSQNICNCICQIQLISETNEGFPFTEGYQQFCPDVYMPKCILLMLTLSREQNAILILLVMNVSGHFLSRGKGRCQIRISHRSVPLNSTCTLQRCYFNYRLHKMGGFPAD